MTRSSLRIFRGSLLLLPILLLLLTTSPGSAQPVENGYLVGTCYSGSNPNDFVIGLYDVRNADLQTPGVNWNPPMWHGPSNNWTAANLGEVFGVDFDAAGNIYTAASRVYSQITPPGGPGGSGAIYRLNAVTGAITNFVTTNASACAAVVGTTTLPNTGSGLGNLCFDEANNQFFVTNFEDGTIYRISAAGVVLSSFDPFVADACVAGVAPLGERLWGINVYNGRVYFSRWVEDGGTGNASPTTFNEIWSVALDGSGDFTGAESLELQMPSLHPSLDYSNPVADIAFNDAGDMLLAERSMRDAANNPFYPAAHKSRLLEYALVGGSWTPSGSTFSLGASGNNSSGGCDYGYGTYNAQTMLPEDCDSSVWGSSDALITAVPNAVYGWARFPETGGTIATSVIIDADADLAVQDKYQLGDIEIYKECRTVPQDPCEGIRVSSQPVQAGDGTCCWDIAISGLAPGTWSSVSAQLLDDSVSFTGVIGPTGWSVTNNGTYITWDTTGAITSASISGLQFCLYSLVGPPQSIEVTLHGADGTLCRDTIRVDCEKMPPPFPPCVLIGEQSIECKENGENGSVYDFSFIVTNQSPFSLPPYSLPAENLVVYPITPNVTVTPGSVNFASPLGHGSSSGPLPFTIGGSGANPGDTVCIVVQLHGAQLEHDYQWCCPPDTLCIVLPDCRDCCDSVEIGMEQGRVRQRGNYGATIEASGVSVLPGPLMSATATVMSVESSDIWCPEQGPAGWSYVNTGGAGPLLAQVTGGAISPSMPLAWGITPPGTGVGWGNVPSGVAMSGGSIRLDMKFPGSRLRWRCRDTLTVCVRYSFTDTACRTCDTVVYHRIPRVGKLEISYPDHVFGGVSKIRKNSDPLHNPPSTGAENPLFEEGLANNAGHGIFSDIWINDLQRVEGPAASIEVTGPGTALLRVDHWWQDDFEGEPEVTLHDMLVTGGPGLRVTGVRNLGSSGEDGVAAEGTVTIGADLPQGASRQFEVRYEEAVAGEEVSLNYTKIQWTYTEAERGAKPDTLRSREFLTVLNRSRGGGEDMVLRKRPGRTKIVAYDIRVTAGQYDTRTSVGPKPWMAPESIRLILPEGVEAIASGPILEKADPLFRFSKTRERGSGLATGKRTWSPYSPSGGKDHDEDGWFESELAPGDSTVITLVVAGDRAVGPFDLVWEGRNSEGVVISEGSLTLDTLTSSVQGGGTPGGLISMLEAWPNPASSTIAAAFDLGRSGNVTLSLVDATGRELMRPIDAERRFVGRNEATIATDELPEGTYFLRLETPHGVQTTRVVVIR